VADGSPPGKDEAAAIDVRVDSAAREGLTGTAPTEVYAPIREPDEVTVGPDHRPLGAQPRWRQDFAVDWPVDAAVARREFVKFLVLVSVAFVAGQAWIATKSLLRRRRTAEPPAPRKIASLGELPPGSARTFQYPGDDPCLLVRDRDGQLFAYSQACTHLSCAVVPEIDSGMLRCPCHEGFFDLRSGRNVAGPPPRPLPRILLEARGDDIYAVGVQSRTV
jgi:nitrite reductase/ring-hydroxylating ferredoxin subunit